MSEDRRKRLKALKARRDASSNGVQNSVPEGTDASDDQKPVLKFRNYAPQTEQLAEHQLAPVALPEVDAMVQRELDVATSSSSVSAATGATAAAETPLNIAPKKPDWDLKRDIDKRLQKLQRRTQRAIVELIRKRLAEEAAEEDEGEAEDACEGAGVKEKTNGDNRD